MRRRSSISFARSQNKSLEHIAIRKVWSGYALDYCGHLVDIMASWILVSYWWRSNSHCFGDRRDRGGNKARHRSRCIGLGFRLNGVSESDGPVLNDRGEVLATWSRHRTRRRIGSDSDETARWDRMDREIMMGKSCAKRTRIRPNRE